MDFGYCIEYFDGLKWETTRPRWFTTPQEAKQAAIDKRKFWFGDYADCDINILVFQELDMAEID